METMLSQDIAAKVLPAPAGMVATADLILPLELLELELSLEGFVGGEPAFCDAVRKAATAARGEFLFDLPASGLIADCRRLAALRIPDAAQRIPDDSGAGTRIIFAALGEDGAAIRLLQSDEDTRLLLRFTDAFINLLQRLPGQSRDA